MLNQSRNDQSKSPAVNLSDRLHCNAIVTVIAGIIAAWISADSTGFLGYPLRHALTGIALGVAILSALPLPGFTPKKCAILAVSIVVALAFNASLLPTVNILGVVIILATLAYLHDGLVSRAITLSAWSVLVLALFHSLAASIPFVWHLANTIGWSFGKIAGGFTGQPLNVGATFGGVDFLVLMISLYIGWLFCISPPRLGAGIYVGIRIIIAHFVYLIVLSYSEKVTAALPVSFYAPESDINWVGTWAWQNAVRSFLPWNLPVLAMILHSIVAAMMLRKSSWLPVQNRSLSSQSNTNINEDEHISPSKLAYDLFVQSCPAILAVLIAVLTSFSPCKSDLSGKTVVAYEKGNISWLKPDYGNPILGGYGMLPMFVESLGGKFIKSSALAQEEISKADVLLILDPNASLNSEQLQRIDNYVNQGGILLQASSAALQPANTSKLKTGTENDLLQKLGFDVRYDTAVPLSTNWEASYQTFSHPVALGIDDIRNNFGFQRGLSIQTSWFNTPLVVGRWGFCSSDGETATQANVPYKSGQLLGDIVLSAEKSFGQGRIVLLGDAECLNNERLSCSYEFVGRLFGYLANRSSGPQAIWRQMLIIASIVLLFFILIKQADAMQLALASGLLSVALILCVNFSNDANAVLPDGRGQSPNNVAYIDASHLEAYSSDLWNNFGIAGYSRLLMRHGFMPLRLNKLSLDRLERAGILTLIAPARKFSAEEISVVHQFVERGGKLICMVGAEEVNGSSELLKDFQITINPSPLKPGESVREPDPFGAMRIMYGLPNDPKLEVQFYAAWPIELIEQSYQSFIPGSADGQSWSVIARTQVGEGSVFVIADTFFAANINLESPTTVAPSQISFWRELLSYPKRVETKSISNEQKAKSPTSNEDLIPEQGPQ